MHEILKSDAYSMTLRSFCFGNNAGWHFYVTRPWRWAATAAAAAAVTAAGVKIMWLVMTAHQFYPPFVDGNLTKMLLIMNLCAIDLITRKIASQTLPIFSKQHKLLLRKWCFQYARKKPTGWTSEAFCRSCQSNSTKAVVLYEEVFYYISEKVLDSVFCWQNDVVDDDGHDADNMWMTTLTTTMTTTTPSMATSICRDIYMTWPTTPSPMATVTTLVLVFPIYWPN